MKKMLVLLAATILSAGAAAAQSTDAAPAPRAGQGPMHGRALTPEQRADLQAQRLTQQLSLSADQTAKVRAVALAQATEMQALRGRFASADNRQGAGQEMKALQEKYDAQLKGVLSADQYTKYSQMRDDRMDKRKEKLKDNRVKARS